MLAELSLLGVPLGCGVALRQARQPSALKTGALLAGILIVAVAVVQLALFELGAETFWSVRILTILGVLIATCVARGLALAGTRINMKRTISDRQPH